jgi:hypothetical protein
MQFPVALRNAICEAGEADLTTVVHLTHCMHTLTFRSALPAFASSFFEYHEFSATQEPAPPNYATFPRSRRRNGEVLPRF